MAVRTASEIINNMKDIFKDQTPEGYVELLEDITDSIPGDNREDYISKEEYDKVMAERDMWSGKYEDMRSKYINRFYSDYDTPNDKGYINASTAQETLEEDEQEDYYKNLFE